MFKLLLTLFLFSVSLLAADQVEMYAKKVETVDSKMVATGDVLVIYQDSYISADRATYDQNSSELELFGNVVSLKGNEYQFVGEHILIDMEHDKKELSPFYMIQKESKLWVSAEKTSACNNKYDIEAGIVSGCNPEDPMWEFHFSSSDYDVDEMWLNMYNARLYIGGIPVFYFPYFGYSFNTSRRSGLLMPSVGLSGSEGVYYEQPIYIVMGDSVDLELKPQLRSKRGQGLYATLRFVDSKDSSGEFTAGYFQENDSYATENQLANDRHYGFGFKYENTRVLENWFGLDLKGQSGLYSDIQWMNDVDYINLASADTINNVTSNQVYSRINLFYNEEDNYYGAYLKYYLNLEDDVKRKTTIQKLPSVQYHHYLDTFLDQHLYYTLNVNADNFTRELGKEGNEVKLDLPLSLQTTLLDDYLNVQYKANVDGRLIDFHGTAASTPLESIYQSGYYAGLSHQFDASSNVIKAYDSYAHAMGLSAIYTTYGTQEKSGYYEAVSDSSTSVDCDDPANSDAVECEFYNFEERIDNVDIQFTQYIIDDDGHELIYHRLSQPIIVGTDSKGRNSLGDFENEFRWNMTQELSFYNDTFYSYLYGVWSKTLNTIRYKDKVFNVGLSYLYENRPYYSTSLTQNQYVNYLNVDASYRYNKHYEYFTKYAFDIEDNIQKYAEIGFLYTKRCWQFGLKYAENNRPVLVDTGSGTESQSIRDRYVYFTIVLRPLGGSEMNYRMTDTLRTN